MHLLEQQSKSRQIERLFEIKLIRRSIICESRKWHCHWAVQPRLDRSSNNELGQPRNQGCWADGPSENSCASHTSRHPPGNYFLPLRERITTPAIPKPTSHSELGSGTKLGAAETTLEVAIRPAATAPTNLMIDFIFIPFKPKISDYGNWALNKLVWAQPLGRNERAIYEPIAKLIGNQALRRSRSVVSASAVRNSDE